MMLYIYLLIYLQLALPLEFKLLEARGFVWFTAILLTE